MKKLFTLALALSLAFAGFAQVKRASVKDVKPVAQQENIVTGDEIYENVGSLPNMTRTYDGHAEELDYSTYDWQTNTAARNLTMNFPDGKVGFAYTIASDASYTDRGTNIVIYDPETETWSSTEGKIEDRKTGFGCAARYGENGIVVVSRDANTLNCGVYIIEDKDNLPASGTVEPLIEWTKDDRNIHFPAVMCSGPDHKHIHILFTALNYTDENGLTNPFFYFRSLDGGQTWDEFKTIDFLGRDYASAYGSGQDAYFMENTGGNRLDIVVNTRRGDGVVLTSLDEGDTWTRTEYYHHPGIDVDFGSDGLGYMYPRWTSALWDNNGTLHVAYEIGGGTGDATSTSYYPTIGGVSYWNSTMPYKGATTPEFGCDPNNPRPLEPGQPFIMDSTYILRDIYYALWLWSDATHEMWSEFIGYPTPLDENEQPLVDPYEATEFNMYESGFHDHGSYNGGICEMPVLVMTPAQDMMVALWMGMDDHHLEGGTTNDLAFFKLFARASMDGGNTWTPMIQLTDDFMLSLTEFTYPQASIANNKLVVAVQTDGEPDTFTIGSGGDTDAFDNCYTGFVFDLEELFNYDGIEEPAVAVTTAMSLYPNPATNQLNVTLNKSNSIVVYNIMCQNVMTVEGHAGVNTLNISDLNSGIYFISAGSETQKFIVK